MPVAYIYRIPLYDAYTYSLVEPGKPRPDNLDVEGLLYQIVTTDDRKRLVKVEQYAEGNLTVDKTYFYDGERLTREEDCFPETNTKSEVRYAYQPDGFTKEYYTDGVLDRRETYTADDRGVIIGCRQTGPDGEKLISWEANEKGDQVHLLDNERESHTEYKYDEKGVMLESKTRVGDQILRDVYHYRDGKEVKVETFAVGLGTEDPVYAEGPGVADEPVPIENEALVFERTREIDPQGKYEVRAGRQRVGYGPDAKYWPSRVEILFDDKKRISDVLAVDTKLAEPALGIECDPNAYYFFEYED